jgi:hypothetical protein
VSQSVCNMKREANRAKEACVTFYIPQENLAVEVTETQTCPANLSRSQLGYRICSVRDLVAEELG